MSGFSSGNYNPLSAPDNWYEEETKLPRFNAAFSALTGLRSLQMNRIESGLLYEATYEQRNIFTNTLGTAGLFPGRGLGGTGGMAEVNLLTYNAMQIGFDTLVSKLTQADATVKFMTDDGNWEVRKKAEQLEKLVQGEFYRLKLYELKQEIELDMLLHGRGYLKFFIDHANHSPRVERVHPLDIYFDELEARDCPPQTMYQTRIVSKSSLRAAYPELTEEINLSTLSSDWLTYSTRALNPTDMVEVLECWRLPTEDGANDGRHGMFINTAQLEYGDWTRMDFPFATMTWTNRRRGPYPIGAAEQTIFLQRNLDRLIQREHECIYMLATPYIIKDLNDEIPPSHFNTDMGNIIQGDLAGGRPMPQVVVSKVVPDDIRVAIAQLKRDIADILGITGLESMGEKPQGVDSAVALQEYTEQSSLRHVKTIKENERFVIRCADKLLETIRDIKNEYGEYAAFGQGRKTIEQIKFTDADLPPNAYMAQMAPANLLPSTPGGKMQRITQLADTGLLNPKQFARLMQSPDIDAAMSDITSTEQDIEWTIYEMCKLNGEYLPPDEHQDLQTGIAQVNDAYLQQRRQKAPGVILERLDRWVSEALVKVQEQQQAQMAAMQPPPAPMGAAPLSPQGQPGGSPAPAAPGGPPQ